MEKRNSINYYGLSIKRLKQWQSDYLSNALAPVFEGFETGFTISGKVKIFNKVYGDWLLVRDPEKTNPVTREENEAIDGIKSTFKIIKTKVTEITRQEKDPAMKKKMTNIVEVLKDYNDLAKATTGKPNTAQKADNLLPSLEKQDKAAMAKFDIAKDAKSMAAYLDTYETERDKRDAIIELTKGKRRAQWPVLNEAMENILKAVDILNDLQEGEDGKSCYPYNALINKISNRFLQLKRRIEKKEKDDKEGKSDGKDDDK